MFGTSYGNNLLLCRGDADAEKLPYFPKKKTGRMGSPSRSNSSIFRNAPDGCIWDLKKDPGAF